RRFPWLAPTPRRRTFHRMGGRDVHFPQVTLCKPFRRNTLHSVFSPFSENAFKKFKPHHDKKERILAEKYNELAM
ncbi:MAG: hypothetical protein J6V61_03795, partial [Bacteroidaceae bacterium]|nr:hypothetical protein [Bacteroidaceae bacterium]